MDLQSFRSTLRESRPPDGLGPALRALWFDARGEWETAHDCSQQDPGSNGAWVHAYLHRKEGDLSNAAYWYSRAGRKMPEGTLDAEWDQIAGTLLEAGD